MSGNLLYELSLAGRTELLERYRAAFKEANGREVVVLYTKAWYQIRDQERVTNVRRRDFIDALIALERRTQEVQP